LSTARQAQLRAECYGHLATTVVGQWVEYPPAERMRRAAAIFFPLLGAALLSLPIPAWHFIGVPGFAIAAAVAGLHRLRQRETFESLSGPCPACGGDRSFALPARAAPPLTLTCPACGEYLRIERR
jgi:rRNA maturation protein Nop10